MFSTFLKLKNYFDEKGSVSGNTVLAKTTI
jgi:hypothetical protein